MIELRRCSCRPFPRRGAQAVEMISRFSSSISPYRVGIFRMSYRIASLIFEAASRRGGHFWADRYAAFSAVISAHRRRIPAAFAGLRRVSRFRRASARRYRVTLLVTSTICYIYHDDYEGHERIDSATTMAFDASRTIEYWPTC